MEPVSITVIGVVTALSVFVRQLLLSRGEDLNNKAQQRALEQEIKELEKLCSELDVNKRFNQVLDQNKDIICDIDEKIEEILKQKMAFVQRYAQITVKEALAIIDSGALVERKAVCDLLREDINTEIKFSDAELQQYQARRVSLWTAHHDLLNDLTADEMMRSANLDRLHKAHEALLEKIYLRHSKSELMSAVTQAKNYLTIPVQFLMQYFQPSKNIDFEKMKDEIASRKKIASLQQKINGDDEDVGGEYQISAKEYDDFAIEEIS